MAEQKTIPTRTTINISGLDIDIFNEYFELALPYTIQSRISEGVGTQEGTSYIEGELLIKMVDEFYPSEIDYFMNEDGTLTVKSESGDVNQYSIDEEGFLIYNELQQLTLGSLNDFGFESAYPWGIGSIIEDRITKTSTPTNSGTGAARFFMTNYSPLLNPEGNNLLVNTAREVEYLVFGVTDLIQSNKKHLFRINIKSNGTPTGNGESITGLIYSKEPNEESYSFFKSLQNSTYRIDSLSGQFTSDWKELLTIIDIDSKGSETEYALFFSTLRSTNGTLESEFENLEIFFDDFSVEYQDL